MIFDNLKQKEYVIRRKDKPNLIVNKDLLAAMLSSAWPIEIDEKQLEGSDLIYSGWFLGEDKQVYITYRGNFVHSTKLTSVLKAFSEINENRNSGLYENEKSIIRIKYAFNNIQSIEPYKQKNKRVDACENAETEFKLK